MRRTSTEIIRVLLVEDDEEDFLITRDLLADQERARFQLDWCPGYDEALAAIEQQRHDVYLVDYYLGKGTGLDLVRAGFANRPIAPVILLTGQGDYEIDLEATTLGVTDYLIKQELTPAALERSIRYAISHQRAVADLAVSEERYALAVRGANDGVWDWDLLRDRMYLSPRWREILDHPEPEGETDPATMFDSVHPEDLEDLRELIDGHLKGETPHLHAEHRVRRADGSWRWVLTRAVAIRDRSGRPTRMAGSMSDITERWIAEQQLRHDALHDSLTGLPNRTLLIDRLEQSLRRAARDPSTGVAVMFLDVDRFKLVNDSLNHDVGDALLVELARRVLGVVRPGDTVARIGGDEFTLLLEGIGEAEAVAVAVRIQLALTSPFKVEDHVLSVSASIGVAFGGGTSTAPELLRNADIAMYAAKRRGRDGYAVFDEGMRSQVIERVARESQLREAVAGELVEVYYQPIVDVRSGRILSFEALARWPSSWAPLEPTIFIADAEDIGLIGSLGRQVLRQALHTLSRWRRDGFVAETVCMSVNVSGRQLDDPDLPSYVNAALQEAGIPANLLRLEITESSLMQRPELIDRGVSQISDTGVGLHLDDFGTGYSSLSALHSFPVSALKIDRSFVASLLDHTTGSETIVRSTVALAHSLGLAVIAEGIEQPDQLERVRDLRCEAGQGFLLGVPRSAAETEQVLGHSGAVGSDALL